MSAQENPWLTQPEGGESKSYEELAHKLYSKPHLMWSTEIISPDAMSTLDAGVMGILKEEFAGTGLFEDMKYWTQQKRVNWIAYKRKRAGETERIASAAAQKENERRAFRDKLLGSLER